MVTRQLKRVKQISLKIEKKCQKWKYVLGGEK